MNEDTVLFTRTGNALYFNVQGGKVKLSAETSERFYVKGQGATGQFKKDNTGKVTGYDLIQNGTSLFFKKVD